MLGVVIEFNFASIIAFLTGILSGAILLFLIYVFHVVRYLRKKDEIRVPFDASVNIATVQEISNKYQDKYKQIISKKSGIDFKLFKELNYDVMVEVASLYYPDSKNPLSELTINEIKELDHQLLDQVDKLLSKFGLKFLGDVKLSKLITLVNAKKTIEENVVVKKTKGLQRVSKLIWNTINIINPLMWIKKGVINPSISVLTNKICLYVIDMVAIKTNNIYSGEQFIQDLTDEENQKFIECVQDMMIEDDDEVDEEQGIEVLDIEDKKREKDNSINSIIANIKHRINKEEIIKDIKDIKQIVTKDKTKK